MGGGPAPGPGGHPAEPGRLLTPAFLWISAATLAFFVAAGMFVPATPRYVAGPLGGDALAVGLVVGSFSISAILLRPLAGRWADRRGRQLMLVAGALLQVVAALGHLAGTSLGMLVAMRLLLGAAEALFFVGALAAATDLAPEKRRGEAVSLVSTALYVGIGVGPALAELLLDRSGYPAIWMVAGLISLVAAGIARLAPETLPPAARRQAGAPTRLLHPRGLIPGLLILSGAWGMGAFFTFLPLLGEELGLSGVGGYFALYAVVVVVLRVVGAQLPDRLGAARLSGTALGLCGAGMAVAWLAATATGLWLATAIFAVGVAFTFPAILTLAVQGVPADERGAVVGTAGLFVDVAFGIAPAALGLMATATGYPSTFLVSAGIAWLGAAWLVGRGRSLAAVHPAA